jgi:hypothetical protein
MTFLWYSTDEFQLQEFDSFYIEINKILMLNECNAVFFMNANDN